jgi:hypothetical protein
MTIGGGSETIEGFSHDLRQLGVTDCGGPMRLSRSMEYHQLGSNTYWGQDAYVFWGGTDPVNNDWQPNRLPSEGSIKALGTTAISRTTPTSPPFSFSVAAGELLSEGIPATFGFETWRERTLRARNAGSEYLNVEFGWLPLINDVRNFSRVVQNHSKLMESYLQGSGKNTRVAYGFPKQVDVTNVASSDLSLRWHPSYAFTGGVKTGELVRTTDQWFKGCYTYYATPLSKGTGLADKARNFAKYADHLYGVRLTPEVLWNLTPWSWAADWFTNAGDIIHNVSEFAHDSLVLKYGYMMSQVSSRTYASVSGGSDGHGTYSGGSATFVREVKTRFPANPYFGFGVTGDLSASQTAILVALGLSRS